MLASKNSGVEEEMRTRNVSVHTHIRKLGGVSKTRKSQQPKVIAVRKEQHLEGVLLGVGSFLSRIYVLVMNPVKGLLILQQRNGKGEDSRWSLFFDQPGSIWMK